MVSVSCCSEGQKEWEWSSPSPPPPPPTPSKPRVSGICSRVLVVVIVRSQGWCHGQDEMTELVTGLRHSSSAHPGRVKIRDENVIFYEPRFKEHQGHVKSPTSEAFNKSAKKKLPVFELIERERVKRAPLKERRIRIIKKERVLNVPRDAFTRHTSLFVACIRKVCQQVGCDVTSRAANAIEEKKERLAIGQEQVLFSFLFVSNLLMFSLPSSRAFYSRANVRLAQRENERLSLSSF